MSLAKHVNGPASNHVAWAKKAPDTERFAETQGLLVALNERKRHSLDRLR
jgi:hypothetical protein